MARETTEPAAITAPLRSTEAVRAGGPVVLVVVALTGGPPRSSCRPTGDRNAARAAGFSGARKEPDMGEIPLPC
ncbi:hypothetical protein GCM10010221_33520 [Streptomyces parvus]|nr:hypothetical protein GCM10010221_33520 [Streptomyces parvus]